MAELGAAASVVGIASLAIQIGQSVRIAADFWHSVQEGPEDIRRLSLELRTLANVLTLIEHEDRSNSILEWQRDLVQQSLLMIKSDVDRLAVLISDISLRSGSTNTGRRTWGRVKGALKEAEISKLRGYIQSSIAVLHLLQSTKTQLATYRIDDTINQLSTSIHAAEEISTPKSSENLPETAGTQSVVSSNENEEEKTSVDSKTLVSIQSRTQSPFSGITTKSTWKVLNSSLGILSFRTTLTKTRTSNEVDEENAAVKNWHKTITIVVSFRFGSCRRGFRLKAMNNIFGFNSLTALRNVPDDSAIFDGCKNGNLPQVKQLIAFNMASPHDVDSAGMSPLHYACMFAHADLCRILVLDYGADVYLTDNHNRIATYTLKDSVMRRRRALGPDTAKIADTLDAVMRLGQFDPLASLDLSYEDVEYQGFDLGYSLPLQNLKYSLQEVSIYDDLRSRCIFLYTNMRVLDVRHSDGVQSVEYLCTEYESMRRRWPADETWNDTGTLLVGAVDQWVLAVNEGQADKAEAEEQKISIMLRLCSDLHRQDDTERTAMDNILSYPGFIVRWVELLKKSGIDVGDYISHELRIHHDGYLHVWKPCCTRYKLKAIEIEIEDRKDYTIETVPERCPEFSHLNSAFTCEGLYRRRWRCAADLDSALIGEDGKPRAIPGGWEEKFKPNSELTWVSKWGGVVWGIEAVTELSNTLQSGMLEDRDRGNSDEVSEESPQK